MFDERWDNVESVWPDDKFVVFGANVICHTFCIFEFAEIFFLKTDGKCFHRMIELS